MNYGAKQYKKTSVGTASQGQILIMLYEAAIRNIKKASAAIEEGDLEGKSAAIGKTHDIVNELLNTLNHDIGGDISKELERLYNFVIEQLLKANSENDRDALASCDQLLSNLLDGWREAIDKVNRGVG